MYTVTVHDHLNGLTADIANTQAQKEEALILANRIEEAMDNVLSYEGEELDT